MPVKHVVLFGFKPGVSRKQIAAIGDKLLSLKQHCPQILSHELGLDLKLTAGQNHPMGANSDLCWSVVVASAEEYDAYNTSDAHTSLVGAIKPLLATRSAVQYDVPESPLRKAEKTREKTPL
mmetsp:Transcript_11520/g.25669  ORF Transcript_11520/g.25669 Transcript_11520/m.25669 type:complete len:122 (-) Transcript_11520:101-466(-)